MPDAPLNAGGATPGFVLPALTTMGVGLVHLALHLVASAKYNNALLVSEEFFRMSHVGK